MTRKAYFAAAFIFCALAGPAQAAPQQAPSAAGQRPAQEEAPARTAGQRPAQEEAPARTAVQVERLPAFTSDDRVLVLAPHPDDETVAVGGVIMKARAAGARIRVACLTNGDNNELAFIVYEKRLTIRKGEFLHMGEVRRRETLAALAFLGVAEKDVVFLGYPDFGTLSILLKYWGDTRPYRSILTRISKVSYPDALSPGSPFVGESILRDVKSVLRDFKPTKIFVSNPSETNPDHMSFYLFTRIALWDLKKEIGEPQLFPYIIHVVGWPKARGYHPELDLDTPPEANFSGMRWWKLDISPEEVKAKHKAISFFKSQIAYNPPYLFTFDRKNELFGDYPPLELQPSFGENFAWQDVGQPYPPVREDAANPEIANLGFARKNGNLYVRLNLTRNFQKDLGISIFLLGYNNNTDFATLPKIDVSIGLLGMRIKDRQKVMFVKGAKFSVKNKQVIVTIPLACLGEPGLHPVQDIDPFSQRVSVQSARLADHQRASSVERFLIRAYRSGDREQVREIAWQTAFLGKPADSFFSGKKFLQDALTCYFTDHEPESCLVAQQEGVVRGYLLGTVDAARMAGVFNRTVALRLALQFFLGGLAFRPKNARLMFKLAASFFKGEFRGEHFPGYPATLHINMEESFRGGGAGSALVDAFLEYLRQKSANGVYLCTMSEAGGFFEKKGFSLLADHPRSYLSHVTGTVLRARIYGRKL